jgi:acetolactate synthase I/II/III large subunit
MSAETTEATRQAPVFQLLAEDLAALGVEMVFGLFGDETAGLVTQLDGAGIRYHAARHENEAIMMAAGYAAATGKLGTCVTSRGPGLTNGLTGAVSASRAGAPLLLIVGADPAGGSGSGVDYKRLHGIEVLTHAGVAVVPASTSAQARQALREAVALATTGCTVALVMPADVLNGRTNDSSGEDEQLRREAVQVVPPAESVKLAADVVSRSRRLLVLAGAGAYRAGAREALIELADRTGALLGTTLNARSLFRGHPYDVGLVGGFASAAAREAASNLDCVLAFGASLNQFTTEFGKWFGSASVIQVDERGENIGRYLHVDVGVAGDARLTAEQLLAAVPPRADGDKPLRTESAAARLASYQPSEDWVSVPPGTALDPQALIAGLDRMLPEDRTVVADAGAHFCFVVPYMSVPSPDRFYSPIGFHSIGLGLGSAVGAALGRPDVPTVLFVGDGALLMSLGELETVARTSLPTLVVVMNDRSYGSEQHFADLMGLPNEVTLLPDVDFAAVARALGIEGIQINSLEELGGLRHRLSGLTGPLLLDCKVANVRPRLYDELLGGRSG